MTQAPAKSAGPLMPTPAQRPAADVVIYDGNCSICTAQARRLARWDRANRLAFLSLHDPEVARRWPELTHDELMRNMYVVEPSERRHRGAAAIRYLTRRLPRLWWLAPLLHLPGSMPLWRALYRQFARRRYRFGRSSGPDGGACDDGACAVHFR